MNLSKTLDKLDNLSNEIKKSIKQEINTLATNLINDYNICNKTTNNKITITELVDQIENSLNLKKDGVCCSITVSGKRCTKSSIRNTLYCKIHQFHQNKDYNKTSSDLILINPTITIKDFKKVFINNEFYHVDNKYIYDIQNGAKIGYIDASGYVFTDDPFILGEFD